MTKRPELLQKDEGKKVAPPEIATNSMPIPVPVKDWNPNPLEDDTIDLMELLATLWRYKWLIMLFPVLGIIGSYTTVQFLPVEYQTQVTFLQISGNGGSSNIGRLGAIASLAGVSLPENSSTMLTDNIEVVLKSRGFAELIVEEMDLLPVIFSKIYDPETQTYDLAKPELGPPKPIDGAGAVMGALEFGKTSEGAKFIAANWNDPVIATELANYSLKALETYLSENTLTASKKNLKFIEKQLEKAEKELRVGEEALRKFNNDKKFFFKFTESEVLAKALVEMQAMHAKAEVDKEVMLQFRNQQSPQVQQLSL
ncbi:MAG: Wzz/FepE/Etk N-terminal domain-containing protein, partial [SAR324 cluster bacterium]|nr:Wzz/FepE/Etk N-terminal domain-containing protein [SAR324 cluster bacterium]